MTTTTLMLLDKLMEDPAAEVYGLDMGRRAGLAPGTAHVILARLEREGWLTTHLESGTHQELGRRPRRFYQLTAHGVREATRALAVARATTRGTALRTSPATGAG